VLAGHEGTASTNTWRYSTAQIRRYFTFLTDNGYQRSDVETLVVAPQPTRRRRSGSTVAA
jgi:site-specific recombinase XerD